LLCSDRHEKVLPLYFARAISRADYLLAKLEAAVLLLLTMSLAPAAVLWFCRKLLDDSRVRAMGHNLDDLVRLAIGGVLIFFYLGSLALMIASFTSRKLISGA